MLNKDFVTFIETLTPNQIIHEFTITQTINYLLEMIQVHHPKLKDTVFIETILLLYLEYKQNKIELFNILYKIINSEGLFSIKNIGILRRWSIVYSRISHLFNELKDKLEFQYDKMLMDYFRPGVGPGYYEAFMRAIVNGHITKVTENEIKELQRALRTGLMKEYTIEDLETLQQSLNNGLVEGFTKRRITFLQNAVDANQINLLSAKQRKVLQRAIDIGLVKSN
jgi:hypothetical protein